MQQPCWLLRALLANYLGEGTPEQVKPPGKINSGVSPRTRYVILLSQIRCTYFQMHISITICMLRVLLLDLLSSRDIKSPEFEFRA